MTNYEKLKQKIQEAVPSLMELSEGCIIENYKGYKFKVLSSVIENSEDDYIVYLGADLLPNTIYVEQLAKRKIKIIGKEPMLNDVLKWMIITTEPCLQFEQDVINFISIWDLLKPFLKDQDQELIDWLVAVGE